MVASTRGAARRPNWAAQELARETAPDELVASDQPYAAYLARRRVPVDARMPLASRRDEGLRRIDGRDGGRPEPRDQLGRERPRPAADVEHPLPGGDPSDIGELWRERHRVPAHEPVCTPQLRR